MLLDLDNLGHAVRLQRGGRDPATSSPGAIRIPRFHGAADTRSPATAAGACLAPRLIDVVTMASRLLAA
jgi:hypothetical protein